MSGQNRRHELDWIRVLAFSLLILFHTGMMFNTWEWHVKNNVTSDTIELFMEFLHQWRMPILFFISGTAVWFAMDKYPGNSFLWERVKRLLWPLVFGMLVVIPPQVYFERLFQGQNYSFSEFYGTVLSGVPYPEGNLSWHHLWYIPYIFVYSVLSFPILRLLKKRNVLDQLTGLDAYLSRGANVVLLCLPMALSEIILRPFWRVNANNLLGDWAQFTTMLLVFLTGFILARSEKTWDRLAQLRRRSLFLGVLSFGLLLTFWEMNLEDPPFWMMVIYRTVRMLNMGLWIAAILGFGRHHLRFSNRFLSYANSAVYPFYIMHQTITVIVGFYLAPLDMNIAVKFVLLAAATVGGCWLFYEGLIKRFSPLRICFGLKWLSKGGAIDRRNVHYPVSPKE